MIETKRKYYESSSFKMAVLFTVLLGMAAVTLFYFIYAYGNGQIISATMVGISADTYNRILWLGSISIFLLLCVALISFALSIFVVNRINIIANTAKRIMITGDLSKRIEIDHRWDDLSNLAYILNDMFARIEQLMQDIRQVSDNIAHDLRTPLTRLRNNLENLKKENHAESENAEKLISEADNLLKTFNALLRITNIEKGKRHSSLTDVNLNDLLKDVAELYEPLAQEKNITLNLKLQTLSYYGDKDLLFQAFANLLDNAMKFTPENGEIIITLAEIEHKKQIVISDTGVGIKDEEKSKVFDRFYRSDASRNTSGNGLGLSLVQAIINLHKGKITLADNQPNGLKVIVCL